MKDIIDRAIEKMIALSDGDLHDIEHFIKVHAYARLIGRSELADSVTQTVLELAAITHDIACPICREKYGSARGNMQELEGMPLCREFLAEFELSDELKERVVWLVGHHHSTDRVSLPEHRILLEADYLVNARESAYPREKLRGERDLIFRTRSGRALFDALYSRMI